MDKRFLDLYNRELMHLRTMGAEFASEYPKIAGRLGGLDEFQPCHDPFVERLLEGFAFLAARVQLKLNAEFPRFTQSLLETIYPHYLAPTPSMTTVQFTPDFDEGGLAEGFCVPRGSLLFSQLGKTDQTKCQYRTAHDIVLWPLKVLQAAYYTRELASLQVNITDNAKAGIRIRLQSTAGLSFNELEMDSLTFHLTGVGEVPMHLYEQLFANVTKVIVCPASRSGKRQKTFDPSCIKRVGFENHQKMLPYDARSFQGYRLIHEYFAFPQRFMYFELTGMKDIIKQCDEDQLDIIILLNNQKVELEGVVDADNFALYCSPAINLFDKRADRVHISDRVSEFHVIPDRTRPMDFEVYRINMVLGYGSHADQTTEFMPFYMARDVADGATKAYYEVNRIPRPMSQKEKLRGRRSRTYAGSEVYISLVDSGAAPYSVDLKQLGIEVLCTNRDLPLHMPIGQGRSDFTMDKAAPYTSIRCRGTPTPPKPSHIEGEIAWRVINHLSLNYLSITDTEGGKGVSAFRDILGLYSNTGHLQTAKQIEGLSDINCKPITRRIKTAGAAAFVRGLEVTVTFEESFFAGSGVFLLGAVLEQFFARYVSINSFTETVVNTVERGEIIRWPMRTGLIPLL